jgi:hypothetical protein
VSEVWFRTESTVYEKDVIAWVLVELVHHNREQQQQQQQQPPPPHPTPLFRVALCVSIALNSLSNALICTA